MSIYDEEDEDKTLIPIHKMDELATDVLDVYERNWYEKTKVFITDPIKLIKHKQRLITELIQSKLN